MNYILQRCVRRQSIKEQNFCNIEPASARSTLTMVALCSGDFQLYSDASSSTLCQLVIELDAPDEFVFSTLGDFLLV